MMLGAGPSVGIAYLNIILSLSLLLVSLLTKVNYKFFERK